MRSAVFRTRVSTYNYAPGRGDREPTWVKPRKLALGGQLNLPALLGSPALLRGETGAPRGPSAGRPGPARRYGNAAALPDCGKPPGLPGAAEGCAGLRWRARPAARTPAWHEAEPEPPRLKRQTAARTGAPAGYASPRVIPYAEWMTKLLSSSFPAMPVLENRTPAAGFARGTTTSAAASVRITPP